MNKTIIIKTLSLLTIILSSPLAFYTLHFIFYNKSLAMEYLFLLPGTIISYIIVGLLIFLSVPTNNKKQTIKE